MLAQSLVQTMYRWSYTMAYSESFVAMMQMAPRRRHSVGRRTWRAAVSLESCWVLASKFRCGEASPLHKFPGSQSGDLRACVGMATHHGTSAPQQGTTGMAHAPPSTNPPLGPEPPSGTFCGCAPPSAAGRGSGTTRGSHPYRACPTAVTWPTQPSAPHATAHRLAVGQCQGAPELANSQGPYCAVGVMPQQLGLSIKSTLHTQPTLRVP